jgi:hypothetical protein
LIHAKVA